MAKAFLIDRAPHDPTIPVSGPFYGPSDLIQEISTNLELPDYAKVLLVSVDNLFTVGEFRREKERFS